MISVDTNIVVRFLTGDDYSQFERAKELFKKKEIFIPLTVILECEWVLRYAYKFNISEINNAFKALLGLSNVACENSGTISQAIQWHEKKMDFADAIHLAKSQNCNLLLTFDKKFIKIASKLTSISIEEP